MSLVLDSSVAVALVNRDETTTNIIQIFYRVARQGAWVPAIWHLEVANSLELAVRRGRFQPRLRDSALADLATLPINIDPETDRHAWGATLQLAVRHRLTLYDAAFLELAQRRRRPLATLDRELRAAAEAEGVPVLG